MGSTGVSGAAGLFDVSHMGQVALSGADAAVALARHRIAQGETPETAAPFAVDDLTGIRGRAHTDGDIGRAGARDGQVAVMWQVRGRGKVK